MKNIKSIHLFTFLGLFCLVLIAWISLTGRYCPHCPDHAWTTSLDYFYIKLGYVDDKMFGGEIGTHKYISILQAYIRSYFAYFVGWGALEMRLLSIIFIILASLVWLHILVKHLSVPTKLASIIFIFMITFDAFVKPSQLARQESLLLFFISIIALLSLKERYFSAGLVAGLAFETHFSGGLFGAAYIFSSFIYYKAYLDKKKWLWLIMGGGLGIVYYILLHYPYLKDIPKILISGSSSEFSNAIYSYYFKASYFRHLPELGLLISCLYYCYKKQLFSINYIYYSSIGLLLSVVFSFLITRENELYFVLVYPLVTIFITSVIYQSKYAIQWYILIILIYIAQYSAILYINREYNEQRYLAELRKRLSQDENIYLGHHIIFFAFNEDPANAKRFYGYDSKVNLKGKSFVLIRDSKLEKINAKPSKMLSDLIPRCSMKLLDQYQYGKRIISFEKYNCKEIIE